MTEERKQGWLDAIKALEDEAFKPAAPARRATDGVNFSLVQAANFLRKKISDGDNPCP